VQKRKAGDDQGGEAKDKEGVKKDFPR